MQILIDTDLIWEALLNRREFGEEASALWQLVQPEQIEAHMTDIGLNKIYLLSSKLKNTETAEQVVAALQTMVHICYVDNRLLEQARSSTLKDFESALEVSCATSLKLDALVTQKPDDFRGADLLILSVNNLVVRHRLEKLLEPSTFS